LISTKGDGSSDAAEFLQQLGLNIEHVRQSPGIHRDAVHQFLIKPQQPHRERGDAEICKPEIGCDDGGMRATSVSRSMTSRTPQTFAALAL
jgi:hypothetical protein